MSMSNDMIFGLVLGGCAGVLAMVVWTVIADRIERRRMDRIADKVIRRHIEDSARMTP